LRIAGLSATCLRKGLRPTHIILLAISFILNADTGLLEELVMIKNLKALRAQNTSPSNFDWLPEADPRRARPISVEQQKKQAKELLKQLKAKDAPALARAKQVFKEGLSEFTLVRAQHILAQEHGFKKWTELKAFAEHSDIARSAINSGEPTALDAQCSTLHIRCGSDVMRALEVAGFDGDFLSFADPYVQGPVVQTSSLSEFLDLRIAFLMGYDLPGKDKFKQGLTKDYEDLGKANQYERVCIWLEHDSYDQLILAKLLHHFSESSHRPKRLEMINITHFPGVKRFNGIGSLPPEAMRVLWREFAPVTEKQLVTGKHAWLALTHPTPELMTQLVASTTPEVPTLAVAFLRHMQELPSTENGLSLTEQQTLQILRDKGGMTGARLFAFNNTHYERLTYMGDAQYWRVLKGLSEIENPAIHIDVREKKPDATFSKQHWHVSLTDLGKQLLNDELHWLKVNTIKRWVGGTKVDSSKGKVWSIGRHDHQIQLTPIETSTANNH
jgi:hypothetical protein